MQAAFDVRGKNPRVLWLAVVEAALRDSMETKPTVRRSAREWIMRDDEDFPLICEMAGLDSGYLRNMMAVKFRASSSQRRLRVPHLAVPDCENLKRHDPANA